MEAEPMANDNAPPHDELLVFTTLLKEALYIKHDLAGRLSQHPRQKSLMKQHQEYQELVGQLTAEFERALANYLTSIKAAAERAARTAMKPSGRPSAACRPTERRTCTQCT